MSARGKEVYIIAGVVAVVLVVAWYFLLLSPTRAKIADLGEQTVAAQGTLDGLKQQVARLETYKKTAPQTRAEIVRIGKMLPASEGMPSLIIELTRSADDAGVDIDSITRGDLQSGSPFGMQTATLQVSGEFFDVQDFLWRLEEYVKFRNAGFRVTGRLLEVTALTMAGGTDASGTSGTMPPLTVTVAVTAYLWSGASAPAAPAPAAASEGGE